MTDSQNLPELKACGFLIVRGEPIESFLLMRHPTRWDLPKGHVDGDETDLECALRELVEETGIRRDDIEIDPEFRFTLQYVVQYERTGDEKFLKTVVIFLGRLIRPVEIQLTEHGECRWFDWAPPHDIQEQTINPLLSAVASHVAP